MRLLRLEMRLDLLEDRLLRIARLLLNMRLLRLEMRLALLEARLLLEL
jgi:hypothetical protein